jgi:amino acid adenylation domain-containing protein
MEGEIDVDTLKAAISEIVNQHEILRTNFHHLPEMPLPLQAIESDHDVEFREIESSEDNHREKFVRIEDLFRKEILCCCDLRDELGARFYVFRISASERVLVTSVPAVFVDSRSLKNLFRQIARGYAARLRGEKLAVQPVQYVDFAEWQKELLEQEEDGDESWDMQNPHFSSPLPLMLGLERATYTIIEYSPESVSSALDAETTAKINRISSIYNASPDVFLLACWQILVWRLTGHKDITIYSMIEGRRIGELREALGPFARFCPARSHVEPDYQFAEMLEIADQSIRSANKYLNYILRQDSGTIEDDRLVEWANAIGFEYEEWPGIEYAGPVKFTYLKQCVCLDRFKLKLGGYRKADGLTIEIQYDPSIFSRENILLIQERYLRLIENAVLDDWAYIVDLEVIGRRELVEIRNNRRTGESIGARGRQVAPLLVRAEREGCLPLSFAQQRLWFLDQLAPNNPFYNVPGAVRLEGRVDLEALERSVNEIVRRHEVLRTRFEVEEDAPVQVIDEWEPRRLERADLKSLTRQEKEEEVSRIIREAAEAGFDLRRGPVFRVKALELQEDEHVVLFNIHHIVSDGWSMEILRREMGALYLAYSAGEVSPLEELPIQYSDFAVWQRSYLAGEILDREVRYWKEQLQDAPIMELPTDHPRPVALTYRGGTERVWIGKELSEGLRKICRQEGATLFMALMAALKVVLMRYSGEEDISVGTVVAGRTRRELEGLIGFFVNTLVLRTDLGGNPNFRVLLEREREVAFGAYAHQEVPFERLVEEINPERDLGRSPLFQVMMALQNLGREESKLSAPPTRERWEEVGTAKFDLSLTLTESREGIVGGLEYSQDLYERETIRRMARHYEKVVEEVVRDVEQGICEIELVSEMEMRQIIEEWNETEGVYGEQRLVHELIEEQAGRSPEAVAMVCGEEQVSYGELNQRANRLAEFLRRLGIGEEVCVGICMERGFGMVESMLGVLKAGGAYLPMDLAYPVERLVFMVEDSGCQVVISDARLAPEFKRAGCRVLDPAADSGETWQEPGQKFESAVESDNLAYVIYTSGSTGKPKGVMISHGSISNRVLWEKKAQPLDGSDALLQLASYSFDVSVWEIFTPLVSGARLILPGPGEHQNPEDISRLIQDHKITVVGFVPSMLDLLLDEPDEARFASLKRVLCGGEALSFEILRRFKSSCDAELYNFYGPTESTIDSTFWKCAMEGEQNIVPIGRPIGNVRVYVLDSRMNLVPMGIPGQLYVGGVGLARGYRRRPNLTSEMFVPNPFSKEPGSRLYKTGDLVRHRENGALEYLGRIDQQVKIRGFRIELKEIESVLRQHPAVREAVVLVTELEDISSPIGSPELEHAQIYRSDRPFFGRLPVDHKEIQLLIDEIDSLSEEEVDVVLQELESQNPTESNQARSGQFG